MSKVMWAKIDGKELSKLTQWCLKFSNRDLIEAIDRASRVLKGMQDVQNMNETLQAINEQIVGKDLQLRAVLFGEKIPIVVGIVDGKFMGTISEE
jgi:hypothetical protein